MSKLQSVQICRYIPDEHETGEGIVGYKSWFKLHVYKLWYQEDHMHKPDKKLKKNKH